MRNLCVIRFHLLVRIYILPVLDISRGAEIGVIICKKIRSIPDLQHPQQSIGHCGTRYLVKTEVITTP